MGREWSELLHLLLPEVVPFQLGKGPLIHVLLCARDQHHVILRACHPVAGPDAETGVVGRHRPQAGTRDIVHPRDLAFGDAVGDK